MAKELEMWRTVSSMLACTIWAWIASAGLVGVGYVVIAGVIVIPAAMWTMHSVMTEWEHEVIHA